jgi:5,5'-dehydrodivanillate O-demethylase oxygenase subunit
METPEQNKLLTQVSKGTPTGELLRRYWQPIGAASDLDAVWTKRVKLLGEELVLFKTRTGELGLVAEHCRHRAASLAFGIPTQGGIRCPYHGWEFNLQGKCTDQPFERDNPNFRAQASISGYPVEELGGLLFAYLGPEPRPLLPRFDGLVVEGAVRMIGRAVLPVNWLQIMENSVDPVHAEWLHGHFHEFLNENAGAKVPNSAPHERIDFHEFEFGITKHRLLKGQSIDADDWRVGHPMVFPNLLSVGNSDSNLRSFVFQYRVPVDDEHTTQFWYTAYQPPAGIVVPPHLLNKIHTYDVPIKDEHGNFIVDYVEGQDIMAWLTQGTIANRPAELLGASDQGVAALRRMLRREVKKVEQGLDPIGTVRDPRKNVRIDLPNEGKANHLSEGFLPLMQRLAVRYSDVLPEVAELMVSVERPPRALQ